MLGAWGYLNVEFDGLRLNLGSILAACLRSKGFMKLQMLRLFGLMFDLFWVHLEFPRSESILGDLVLWDSMFGALGHRFGSLETSKRSF